MEPAIIKMVEAIKEKDSKPQRNLASAINHWLMFFC
jgi:hypothetical protein